MPTPHIDVRHIAKLARLELNDAEVSVFESQLDAVLGYVDKLAELDVSGIELASSATGGIDRMRADVPGASLSPEAVLQNAPDQAQGQIRVPKVVADA